MPSSTPKKSPATKRSTSTKKRGGTAPKQPAHRSGVLTMLVPAVLVAVAIVVTTVVVVMREDAARDEAARAFAEDADQVEGLSFYDDLSRNHVEGDVTYEQTPPAGGDHNAMWVNCGAYEQDVPEELAVHSLEHGAVWLAYQPSADTDVVETLTAFADQNGWVLVSPVEGLSSPVVATAWGARLELDDVDDAKLEGFITQFAQSSEAPEPGAPCTGGVDL